MNSYAFLALLGLLATGCSSASPPPTDGGTSDGSVYSDAANDGPVDATSAPDAGLPEPPPPPPWNPPIPIDGIGWRESSEPLCSPYAGRPLGRGVDIYADGRGVFVLESILNEVFTAPPFEDGLTVHFNDGTGWIPWHDLPAEPGVVGADSLAGVESGPLFLWSGGCPLERLDGPDAAECEYADAEVIAAAPTGPDELYVITHGPELALVGIVSGVATTLDTLSSTSIVNGLWGTSTDAIVLLSDGLRHGTPTSGLEPMPAPPSADELTTISGSAIDDLWVGTFGADLFHWDGSSWSGPTDTGLAEPLVSLWLDGDTVYFAGDGGFGRRNVDGSVEVIFEVPLDYRGAITAMTGNGDRGEVYLSLVDADFYDYACGPAMLIVYDGVTLRRF